LNSFLNNEQWFDCFRLSPDVLDEYHRRLESYSPDCIVAYASALGTLAQHLADRGLRPNYPRKCLVTGAEKLYDEHRKAVEFVFRKPVYERYGSRDSGLIGHQIPYTADGSFEVDWANLMVEPETDEAESGILITKLNADGMPMIRYHTGDLGRFPKGSKPGQPVLSLLSVAGRQVDRIWLPNGRFIHGNEFPHLMKNHPVREFMVVQSEDYSVMVQIVPEPCFTTKDRAAMLSTIQSNLPGLPVEILFAESIPKTKANKWRPVTTDVKRES